MLFLKKYSIMLGYHWEGTLDKELSDTWLLITSTVCWQCGFFLYIYWLSWCWKNTLLSVFFNQAPTNSPVFDLYLSKFIFQSCSFQESKSFNNFQHWCLAIEVTMGCWESEKETLQLEWRLWKHAVLFLILDRFKFCWAIKLWCLYTKW